MTKFFTISGVRINSASTISDVPVPSVMARFGTASIAWPSCSVGTTSSAALMSDSLHNGPAEQTGGFDDEDGDDQRKRDRQFQLIADAWNVGAGKILEDADQEAADHGPERTCQSA